MQGKPPDFMTRFELPSVFYLDSPRNASLSTLELGHQIVHSYISEPSWTWNDETQKLTGLDGAYFTSDRRRHTVLFWVEIGMLATMIETVGREDVISVTVRWDTHGLREVSETFGVGPDEPRHGAAGEGTS